MMLTVSRTSRRSATEGLACMKIRHRAVATCLAVASTMLLSAPVARAEDADECIAANERSVPLRKTGKLIEARKELAACAASACPDPVRSSCQSRLVEVDRAVPSVVFQVKDGAGNDVSTVKITMDGQPLAQRGAGAAIALDPGEHTFSFETAGHPPMKKTLVIVEGAKDRVELVTLSDGAAAPAADSERAAPAGGGGGGGTQRMIGLVIGGVGIVGLVVGSVLGLMASSSWNTAQKDAWPQAQTDQQTASAYATGSTIAFIAGGAAVAGGAVLWLTAPKAERSPSSGAAAWAIAPRVGPGGGGLVLRGGF
jgi:hypothetical protein